MARRGRAVLTGPRIKVSFYDPDRRQSVSVTVAGARLEDVAREGAQALGRRWWTTKLNSRRHKRRL